MEFCAAWKVGWGIGDGGSHDLIIRSSSSSQNFQFFRFFWEFFIQPEKNREKMSTQKPYLDHCKVPHFGRVKNGNHYRVFIPFYHHPHHHTHPLQREIPIAERTDSFYNR